MLHNVGSQLVADPIHIPDGAAQQMLDTIGRRVAAGFGQLPTVLALDRTQESLQVGQRALPGFGAGKMRTDALDEVVEIGYPLLNPGQVRTLLLV